MIMVCVGSLKIHFFTMINFAASGDELMRIIHISRYLTSAYFIANNIRDSLFFLIHRPFSKN